MPMSIALLAKMTGTVHSGGAGGRPLSKQSRGRTMEGRNSSKSPTTVRTKSQLSASQSGKTLPAIQKANVMGYTFKKETLKTNSNQPPQVVYTMQKSSEVSRVPSSTSLRSRVSEAFGFEGSFPLTAVPESVYEDEPDPIDQWVAAKKREVSNLLQQKKAMVRGAVPTGMPLLRVFG
jgi:hypothetical protein